MTTIRTRLLATSMITGLALIAVPAGAAFAADATADASPMATMDQGAQAPAAAPVQQLRATAEATAEAATTGEIVVTGSRIPQPNLTSVSPIQAVGHQEFQMTGKTDVVDLLNTLPSNFQNTTQDFSNTTNPLTAPGGITTADLRGLGPQRTLVLVNGRRLGIGDPNTGNPNPAPDLDQIPVALIDHVEVLTGGASATYGSDAIAGVVNFIMKTDFEGVQLDGTLGINQHNNGQGWIQDAVRAGGSTPATGSVWDGQSSDFSVIMGSNAPDGKGNVTGYFEFRHATPVNEGDRDYSGCLLIKTAERSGFCANSSNSNLFQPIIGGIPGTAFSVVGNQLLPNPQAGSVPPAAFNSAPYEYLSRNDNRYLAGFFAHYEITPWAQPYAEFMFMDDRSNSAIAPSGLFQGGNTTPNSNGNWLVNCANPFLSGQQQVAIGCSPAMIAADSQVALNIGRRNVEGGPRTASYDHSNYRIVLGLKGDIGDAWHYDGYGSYYYTSLYNANGGYLSIQGIQNALLVGGTAANPFCENPAASGCVPYNIFQQGGVTPAALNYLTEPGTSHGATEESIFEFDLTGDLGKYGWKSPWANDGVGVSFGTESRWDRLTFQPDAAELSGDLSGFAGASVPVDAAIGVQEGYFETRIPIAQKQPFADDMYLEGGVRYSDYSTSGGVTTFKVGGQWSPVPDFTLRGSYDRAIRAANIIEIATPQSVTNTSVVSVDPCAPTVNSHGALVNATATLAQCERTGVTAAQYGNGGTTSQIVQCPAGQCAILQGGNPNLSPEIADSWSIGGLFRPTGGMLRGLSLSVDYWDIKIADQISTVPISLTLAECLDSGNPAACSLVKRTPNGNLFGTTIAGGGYITAFDQNIAATDTAGIDFQADYRLNLEDVNVHGWGSLAFNFVGTYQVKAATTLAPGVAPYDCAGLFGPTCIAVSPTWRHTFSMTWDTPWNVLARLQWRYIGSTSLDANSTQSTLALLTNLSGGSPAFGPGDNNLPAVNYLDLSAAWRVNTILTVRAGINNILDQDPPIISQPIAGIGAPNTYPTYDLLGRSMFISATAKF
ncbi:MAG TPA: TonB-dependent receptor [Caulobacteraceae bacterium]|nr:TonB-dependent receptor [Caulobacteraceae bacterium]